jgi:hypothetical protein
LRFLGPFWKKGKGSTTCSFFNDEISKTTAIETFKTSSFGALVCEMFEELFTKRSFTTFLLLAKGWAMSSTSHCLSHYIWLSGGTKYKHFSRFYLFLSVTVWQMRRRLWLHFYQKLDGLLPAGVLFVLIDDTVRKKSGKKIEGCSHYNNRAGSARQEYRSLWGLNFVYMCFRIEVGSYQYSVPGGVRLYLKESTAEKLGCQYLTRSALAREMLDQLLEAMPQRRFHLIADGGYSTAEMGQGLDERISYTGRMIIDAAIYEVPPPRKGGQMGRPAMRGKQIPAPREWPELYPDLEKDWLPHPSEKGAWIRSCVGRWHNFMKGKNLLIVVIYRPAWKESNNKKRQRAAIQAIFSTEITHPNELVRTYQKRWAVEIDIRDAYAYYGLGKAHLRKFKAIEALNQIRIIWAACRTIWFYQNLGEQPIKLNWLRPWYRKKDKPSQRDIAFELRNEMIGTGLFAIPVLGQGLDKSPPSSQQNKARAA